MIKTIGLITNDPWYFLSHCPSSDALFFTAQYLLAGVTYLFIYFVQIVALVNNVFVCIRLQMVSHFSTEQLVAITCQEGKGAVQQQTDKSRIKWDSKASRFSNLPKVSSSFSWRWKCIRRVWWLVKDAHGQLWRDCPRLWKSDSRKRMEWIMEHCSWEVQ